MKKEDITTREKLIAYLAQCRRELKDPDISHIDLSGMDLTAICFDYAHAEGTNFNDCTLTDCTFYYARLIRATFERVSGQCVDFTKACLSVANFGAANLNRSCFANADLYNSTFDNAILYACDFYKTELLGTSFINAVLYHCQFICTHSMGKCEFTNANVQGSVFTDSYLSCCKGLETCDGFDIPLACPQTGSFIGWKIAYGLNEEKPLIIGKLPFSVMAESMPDILPHVLIKLQIPADARRSSATTAKCRANKAKVLEIISLDGSKSFKKALSMHDLGFVYKVGDTVSVSNFDPNRFEECSTGIHFFMSKETALAYLGLRVQKCPIRR